MIESVIYFLLISKNNKCEHTCCHCFVCNVSSLTGWTGNQQLILDLLTDSFRARGLMTSFFGILTVWEKTSQTSEDTPRSSAHLPVTFDLFLHYQL